MRLLGRDPAQASVILASGIAYNSSIALNARLQEALLSRDVHRPG